MVRRKPHILIIGAGMAGLSAAHHLLLFGGASSFHLTLLEASHRLGGRILTSEIGGNRVELGATWIHGIDGSPLFRIAQTVGATTTHSTSAPFERQDGSFPHAPVVVAEGGLVVPPSISAPVMDLYKKLLHQIRSHEKLDSTQKALRSIGAFVTQGFDAFLSQQNDASHSENLLFDCLSDDGLLGMPNHAPPWSVRSLHEALIIMNECMERVDTSADTLYDLDIHAEREYTDYPGEHVTIPGGYMSIIDELAASTPAELIHLGKMADKIVWNRACDFPVWVHCSDGSCYEADHVIVTVPLGVLKASIMPADMCPWASPEGRPVCRSVEDLQSGVDVAKQEASSSALFEPPLPPCKVEAISRLGYGLVNKLFLQVNTCRLSASQLRLLNSHIQLLYKRNPEPGDHPIPWWMRKTVSMCPIYSGSGVLLCWFAGNEALAIESLSDEEIMSGVAQTLASFGMARRRSSVKSRSRRSRHNTEFSSGSSDSEDSMSTRGESQSSNSSDSEETYDEVDNGGMCTSDNFRSMFSGILRSKWGSDPLFRGSYSFVATGASGDDIEKLAEPLPRVDNRSNGDADAGLGVIDANKKAYIQGNVRGDNALAASVPDSCIDDTFRNEEASGDSSPLQLLFAGEATVRNLYSTTHGAYLSGWREAVRLLSHYSLNPSVAPL